MDGSYNCLGFETFWGWYNVKFCVLLNLLCLLWFWCCGLLVFFLGLF